MLTTLVLLLRLSLVVIIRLGVQRDQVRQFVTSLIDHHEVSISVICSKDAQLNGVRELAWEAMSMLKAIKGII